MNDLQQNQQFIQALQLHKNGKINEAKNLYLSLLAAYSSSPRLLNNLAMIEFQQGRFEPGLEYLEKSLGIDPTQFTAYGNRGAALFTLNRFDEALNDYNRAIALNNNYAEAYYNRALLYEKQQKLQDALTEYDRAIKSKSNYADAYNNRGNILKILEKYEEALSSYDSAIKFNPHHAEAFSNRGVILKKLKKHQDALLSYRRAISLNRNYADAYHNCGNVLIELNQFENAITCLKKAIQINPDYASAYNSLGNALMELKEFSNAFSNYEKAIMINSSQLNEQNLNYPIQKSIANSTAQELADIHWNKGLLKILLGEYEEGWQLYEYRRKRKGQEKHYPIYDQPLWLGQESVANKILYIYPEQGLGDFIQFCRYVRLVEKLGANVILSVPAPLQSIIQTMGLSAKIVRKDERVAEFDFHCPIMSLPLAFKTTVETIPNNIPYLFSDHFKKNYWKQELAKASHVLKVGLVWSGSTDHMKDHNRSLTLDQLTPILNLPVMFYSLQKEVREQDKITLSKLNQIDEYHEELNDFSDTAAMVDCLDLVISVDTSVAHLAGAMGKRVWILISYLPDYRWMLDREDTPWYPTARLFRQANVGDWHRAILDVRKALEELLESKVLV